MPEPKTPPTNKALHIRKPHARLPKQLGGPLIVGLIAGLLGGFLALLAFSNYFSVDKNRSQQVVLEESSAIIDVVNRVGPSVVNISTNGVSQTFFGFSQATQASGSGIILSKDGLILTNKHVVVGANSITVTTSDNKEYKNAKVVGTDPLNDVAFIKIDASGLTPAVLGDSDQIVVGQRVVAIGNALGQFSNTVTSGIISGIGRPVVAGEGTSETERLQDLLQTDAAINPGNSGGPLVDMEGQVIGMNTAVAGNAQNIGFAIPISQVKADISSIQSSGKLQKAYLGVRYLDINSDVSRQYSLSVDQGAYLIGNSGQPAIIAGGPADKAGLKAGDVITQVNGSDINAKQSLATLIGQHQPGDVVTLTILRVGKSQQISVTLGTLPGS